MAKRLKCNSCGGTYQDTRDGSAPAYFHACPDGTENPRNENLKRDPDDPTKLVMISEGAGVTEVE